MASLLPEPQSFRTPRSGDPESRYSNSEIPRCAIAHLRLALPRAPERRTLVMILEALGQLVDIFRRPARHFHAEVQPHLGQHLLDLVQRLAAEVRGAEHFRFRLLHEVADI